MQTDEESRRSIGRSIVGVVRADDVEVRQGGAGFVLAKHDVSMTQGGGGPIVAGGERRVARRGADRYSPASSRTGVAIGAGARRPPR